MSAWSSIIGLLCVIAFRPTSAYAAKPVIYEVVHVVDNHIQEQVAKETQAGWEPVSMTMWVDSPAQYANGVVIFQEVNLWPETRGGLLYTLAVLAYDLISCPEEEFHEDFPFRRSRTPCCRPALICLIALFTTYSTSAQQTKGKGKADAKATANPRISYPGYITGTVTSEKGPEAGVWVIAETNDLQTKMIKIVVTDDQGRYVLPELPAANYKVWVRGYGIAGFHPDRFEAHHHSGGAESGDREDSPGSREGLSRRLLAVAAGSAAQEPVSRNGENPTPTRTATALTSRMIDQDHWINRLKSGCNFCHQLGNPLTRDVEHVFAAKPELKTA